MNSQPICIKDLEDFALKALPKNAYGYYASGADDEQTLRDNTNAFKRLRLRPNILRDVSSVDTSTTVLDQKIDFPICIAPTAMQRMAHPDGELATAKAAKAFDTCMMLSSWATTSIEDVANAAPGGLRWFQLYIYKDRNIVLDLVRRAEKCGYKAIAVTVDTPILGQRLEDVRNKFALPSHFSLANYKQDDEHSDGVKSDKDSGLAAYVKSLIDPSLNWKDIEWLKKQTSLPILVKGVLTKEAALEALEHNVDGIIVSNHGARQLDGVTSTIDALPEVIEAVNGKVEVYLDGGIRQGTDAFKALALGAKAVFIGRPVLWGLTYGGEVGVKKVLEILKNEFERCLTLTGCRSVSEIKKSMVAHESRYYCRL
ncbi:2-Hydroxyacid oxidase 1-like [Rhopilema esculentum]|uniref:2-Hydroxyacid oxidase 1-like n=1 Tax=Rhopilema esculentum TaxID=499914 RepID=UPI0031DE7F80|eukprot:gene2635-834_t